MGDYDTPWFSEETEEVLKKILVVLLVLCFIRIIYIVGYEIGRACEDPSNEISRDVHEMGACGCELKKSSCGDESC